MGGACGTHGVKRITYRLLVGNPKERRPVLRTRSRGKGHFKMDLKKIGWMGVDWILLPPDRKK
jgi:hypothetical protein